MTSTIETTANAILLQMNQDISQINPDNIIQRAEKSYQIVKQSVRKLNDCIEQYGFLNIEEEINYFKYIKPKMLREQIYYAELYHQEALKPLTDKETIEQYLKDILSNYRQYFERNLTFYNYYRMGKTHLDSLLFTRDAEAPHLPPEYMIDGDPNVSTVCCYKLARLQALEILKSHIQNDINNLYRQQPNPENEEPYRLIWTDSKVALIELAYAIQSRGALNHGNVDIKTVMNILQEVFQIHLGNYYGVYQQNIRIRKKNRTAYLDQLRKDLEKRMDESEENPRFR